MTAAAPMYRRPALHQRVAAEGDDDTRRDPSVATMIALMACIRFSAWSKTMEHGDSNTSSVTSRASSPVFS